MECKLFEVRDVGTFIPVLATKLASDKKEESYLLGRSGFLNRTKSVALTKLVSGETQLDAYEWGNARTMLIAHTHIEKNFDTLESGQVIDVEYILGETDKPKESERIEFLY